MAVADLRSARNRFELAACWSRYLIDEMIERKESGSSGIYASVFPFTMHEGKVVVPAGAYPIGHPPSVDAASHFLNSQEELFAYFVVLTGEPGTPGEWATPAWTPKERAEIPIGVPGDLCEEGDYEYYLIAALVCPEYPVTWSARYDGDKFGPVRFAKGTFGGTLVGLAGLGDH